jgi:murein DD-endopeptidase MepM/ murein hydrolase activator NlpD
MPDFKQVREYLRGHTGWLIALSTLPLLGMVAAFGTAPDTLTANVIQETTVQTLDLPEPVALDTGSFDFWREEKIRAGDNLASLMARMGVAGEDAQRILANKDVVGKLGKMAAGRTLLARVTTSGQLLLLRYIADDKRLLSIERVQGQFREREEAIQLEPTLVMRSGEVKYSLFGATDAANIPDSIASEMAEAFSGEIDFHRDLRKGDRFAVVYEAFFHEGRLLKTGRLMAAEFNNDGKLVQALNFVDPEGNAGYYTPQGRSLKRAFLKSPLPFTRITSGFSNSRYHPLLKEWRAHRGIDYGAPQGTPVRAVADGGVKFVGSQRGYGNLIVLEHSGAYSTAYGHLSRFDKSLRRGGRVRQGQVIGYVGMTGLASGPHLHYEFRVAGVQQNPLAMKQPTATPLDNRYKARFLADSGPLMTRLNLVRDHKVSALD